MAEIKWAFGSAFGAKYVGLPGHINGWKGLPTEAFGCSYKTCTRRLQEWSRLGL
jgi:hypothetical protein